MKTYSVYVNGRFVSTIKGQYDELYDMIYQLYGTDNFQIKG